jgi:hypothetical protein
MVLGVGILGRAILRAFKRSTVLACSCLAAIYVFLPLYFIRADAPEENVWSDVPRKSTPSDMGRTREVTGSSHVSSADVSQA